jgi:hypothetical protein
MLVGETAPISVGSVEDSRLPFPSKVDAPSMHASLNLYRFYRDAATLRGMDNGVAVYLPKPLIERLDAVAHDELRSRTNATRWLLEQALRDREPVEVVEAGDVS